jgi:predicted amidohydrolase
MITIASAQYPITAHASFKAWSLHVEKWVAEASQKQAQLLLFPEFGSMELVSLFSEDIQKDIHLQIFELQNLRQDFCTIYAELAHKYKTIVVAPSFPVVEKNKTVNRCYVFSPKGLIGHQDKFFMTRFENEEWGIQSGEKLLSIFETDFGNFGIQICYDVEFAIGSQLLASAGVQLILAPSCTETIRGATRVHVGARARALENQAYVVVSQTVGKAEWSPAVDLNYGFTGFYCTPDKGLPEEGIIATGTPHQEGWNIHQLDFSLLETVRNNGQVFNFKDQQQLFSQFKEEKLVVKEYQC